MQLANVREALARRAVINDVPIVSERDQKEAVVRVLVLVHDALERIKGLVLPVERRDKIAVIEDRIDHGVSHCISLRVVGLDMLYVDHARC